MIPHGTTTGPSASTTGASPPRALLNCTISQAWFQWVSGCIHLADSFPTNKQPGGEAGSAYLSLNTRRLRNNTQLGGEIFYSRADVDAISFRVSARVSGASGAVAGFFTYHNDTQESDIEILTRDGDGRVHFSNQPTTDKNEKIISGATFNDSLPESTSTNDWAVYRLDWLPSLNMSVWYVDGEQLRTTQTNVPQIASTVFIDMWSNSGWWSGDMAVGEQATLEIQWIEMAFNASATATSVPDDGVVCTIDEGVGSPVEACGGRLEPTLTALAVLALTVAAYGTVR